MGVGLALSQPSCTLLGFLCMIAPSLVGHPGLNSQLRAELGRSRGLCLHWKLRVEVAAWTEYSIAIPLWTGLYGSLCLKRCVPCGVRDSYLWPHGFPILPPCRPLPTSSWPKGALGGSFGPAVLMLLSSSGLITDS